MSNFSEIRPGRAALMHAYRWADGLTALYNFSRIERFYGDLLSPTTLKAIQVFM